MCILFLYVNNEAHIGEYQLIIASNRDEYYTRPSKAAGRWHHSPHCISGLDLEGDKTGGTWLGLSEKGKIGFLLNLAKPGGPDIKKKGRGFLVSDYLTSSQSPVDYVQPIVKDKDQYNTFNLVLAEKRLKNWNFIDFSSDDNQPSCVLEPGIHAWGNCTRSIPWKKVQHGKSLFTDIINKHKTITNKDRLVEELMIFLQDRSPNIPDPDLEGTHVGKPKEVVQRLSAIFVDLNVASYGTRTNTLVLLDGEGRGQLIERNMREPIDSTNPVWETQSISFNMEDASHL